MKTQNARRKSFDVQVVDVTSENMEEVAEWCGGTIIGEGAKRCIKIPDKNALNNQQTRAYKGDKVVYHAELNSFKKFGPKSFSKTFDVIEDAGVVLKPVEVLEINLDPAGDGVVVEDAPVATDGVDPKTLGN